MSNLFNSHLELGSPPHTWRKRNGETQLVSEDRITSTYVEKTYHRYSLNTIS